MRPNLLFYFTDQQRWDTLGCMGQPLPITPCLDGLAADVIEKCPHLELQGLMCIPPVYNAGAAARPYFAKLRELRDKLSASTGLALPHLSMGMSGDFEWAIEEGATFVRVGTDIFGPRPPKKS